MICAEMSMEQLWLHVFKGVQVSQSVLVWPAAQLVNRNYTVFG